MAGPKNSAGRQLYSDWPYDGGMGAGNWRFWKIESGVPPWDTTPSSRPWAQARSNASDLYIPAGSDCRRPSASLVPFLLAGYDFDRDAPKIFATDGPFKESAVQFMTPPDMDI